MHPLFEKADRLSKDVIGAAIEVHRLKGPGLLESIYEKCLKRELELKNYSARSQVAVQLEYKGAIFEETLKVDLLVDECLVVEVKAVDQVHPIHKAQLMTYMKLLDMPIGLLFNFCDQTLTNGLSRMILPGANIS